MGHPYQIKISSICISILLILACANPTAAAEITHDNNAKYQVDGMVEGDLAVIVNGEDGGLYAITTSPTNPAPWFKSLKQYDTVKLLRDNNGNIIYDENRSVTVLIPSSTANTQANNYWILPSANANPSIIATSSGSAIIAIYLIPGVGEVALVTTGVVIIAGITYYIATSDNPTAHKIRDAFNTNTATIIRFTENANSNTITILNNKLPFTTSKVRADYEAEQDYNNSKEKGTPTKNHKDRIGHGIDTNADDIRPYMSVSLFQNQVDKDNECPKQIRYYGKDGKAEEDIDFSGRPETKEFPHRHTWKHDLIEQGVTDSTQTRPYAELGIGEIFKKLWDTNKCKDYDYKNHIFKTKKDL